MQAQRIFATGRDGGEGLEKRAALDHLGFLYGKNFALAHAGVQGFLQDRKRLFRHLHGFRDRFDLRGALDHA